jgi:hypothetical protein
MLSALQILTTLSTCIFAGAAIYINVAEHPARMGCTTSIAATVWAPSYKRAYVMQASLAAAGLLGGLLVWLFGGGLGWLIGALLIGAVIPFTFIVIMPTNKRLLESGRDLGSAETRELLVRWGQLHAVRSALSAVASVVYLVLLHGT